MTTTADLLPSIADEPWRRDASCSYSPDPTLWDATIDGETTDHRNQRHALAKHICGSCPVARECRDAVDPRKDSGIRAARLLPTHSVGHNGPQPITHGTEGGYKAHMRRKEKACKPCKAAAAEARAIRDMKHGTESGARAHYRLGEKACTACRIASIEAKERRAKRAAS